MPVPAVLLFLFAIIASGMLLAGSFRLKLGHEARYLDLYFYFITITGIRERGKFSIRPNRVGVVLFEKWSTAFTDGMAMA